MKTIFNTPCPTLRFLPVPLVLLCLASWSTQSWADEVTNEIARPIRVQRDLEYRRVDGQGVLADLYRPDDDQIYPLVLMVHGGAWSSGDKWNLADHARELAQAGFVVLSINYRLAPKYQMPEQIADCRAALEWAAAQATQWKADAQRICLWGYSAGAHLSAWMATDRQPGQPAIRCVVAGGAPCDFEFIPLDSSALAHVMGGTRHMVPESYAQASPLTHASADSPPFFFFHGSADLLVPPESSRKLYERLRSLGVETEYLTVENMGHLLTFLNSSARRQAIEYLRKHTSEEAN